jgi:hypothetical protein
MSFSELKTWGKCSWRHWLLYVLDLREFGDTIYTDFGTIVHDASEGYLRTGVMDVDTAIQKIKDIWIERGYPEIPEEELQYPDVTLKKRVYTTWPEGWPSYADPELESWLVNCREILEGIPDWLDNEFPGWEFVDAEAELNEEMEGLPLRFRGYIDAIIKVKNKKGKYIYWILDWKTSGARGWDKRKRTDFFMTMQVVLYKHFWTKKNNIPLRDARCGYVILRRDVKKKTSRIGLFDVSAGPKTVARALKWLRSMIKMVESKRTLKNRYECTFCEFKGTDKCKLNL